MTRSIPLVIISGCLLFASVPARAQSFSFGLKAGMPLTAAISFSDFRTLPTHYDRPYIIGPTAELHLPFSLSFEVDALFRRNGFSQTFSASFPVVSTYYARTTINDWQIPVLVKYELHSGKLRPFADGGFVFRRVTTVSPSYESPVNPSTLGVVVGGGVTLRVLRLALSPEIRYTHWPTVPYPLSEFTANSNQNQADFVLGISVGRP